MATRTKGIYLALIGASLWGASGVATQFLLHDKNFSSEWLVVIRLLIAGLILLTYAKLHLQLDIFAIWRQRNEQRQLILFGILGLLGVQYTYFEAIRTSNAATATIFQYLMPIIIVGYFAFRQRALPAGHEILAVVLALLGTVILVTKGDFTSLALSPEAVFWGITSAFAGAFYTVQPGTLLKNWPAALIIGWGMIVGGIFMTCLYPPHFQGLFDTGATLTTAFVVFFGTIVAFCAYLGSTKYISSTQTSIIASVEPFAAVILSALLLDVSFSAAECLGALFIISTVFILAR